MKPFKVAYKVVRHNSNEIYKGFGFHHLSDATQYYVYPDNQSFKGTTLCQSFYDQSLEKDRQEMMINAVKFQ